MSVADSNKALLVAEGDTRALDTCATVLAWGTPGGPVDGGGGRWPPLMVRRGQEHCCEALFQLSLSAVGKPAMAAASASRCFADGVAILTPLALDVDGFDS